MTSPNSFQLPFVIQSTPGNGFRWLHLIIGLPILVFIFVSQSENDTFEGLAVIAVISIPCELLRFWIRRTFSFRCVIDTEGVHYKSRLETWDEPLSAYAGVDWHEDTIRDTGRYWQSDSRIDWRAVLGHGSDAKCNVEIASSNMAGRKRVTDRKIWHAAAQTLGLPKRQFKEGTAVTTEPMTQGIPEFAPKRRTSFEPQPQKVGISVAPLKVRRSLFSWILPVFFSVAFAYLIFVGIQTGDLAYAVDERRGPLFIGLIMFVFLWFWTLSAFSFRVEAEGVVITSSLGSWIYRTQRADLSQLSEVLTNDAPLGLGPSTLTLNFEGRMRVFFVGVKYHEARAVKRLLATFIA
ncbi:hypothetical protein [Parasedimentitalea maritima]|uniref:Uncharacterized protein n=1 Tax=Parasedimentitalea maritima TaxID=2578117 RepID=A0A6A4R7B7_9RHOB|nr:hypothetical protein [Zongyanglinia marina]KAE9626410.1 hypothetical protein GP644_21170 [Zongyanglinia marina]